MRKPGRPKNLLLAEKRKSSILQAAIKAFSTNGYHSTDVGEIASIANISKGTVFHYFETKEALFNNCLRYMLNLLNEELQEVTKNLSISLEMIEKVIRGYFAFFDRNPECLELIVQEKSIFKHKESTYFETKKENSSSWDALTETLISEGVLRNDSVKHMSNTVGAMLYGALFQNYFSNSSDSLESQTDEVLNTLFLGILSETEREQLVNSKN